MPSVPSDEEDEGSFISGFPDGAGFDLHQEGAGDQEQHRQGAADGLKGKGTDFVHSHTLRDEGEAPDDGCQQQTKAASDLFLHILITDAYSSTNW